MTKAYDFGWNVCLTMDHLIFILFFFFTWESHQIPHTNVDGLLVLCQTIRIKPCGIYGLQIFLVNLCNKYWLFFYWIHTTKNPLKLKCRICPEATRFSKKDVRVNYRTLLIWKSRLGLLCLKKSWPGRKINVLLYIFKFFFLME